jgi:peroxiredoxin
MSTVNPCLLATILAMAAPTAQAAGIGTPIPACNLKNLTDGKALSLAKPGKVVYVDFWASWCGPCGQSMPFLNDMHEQLQSKNFEVVAVNLDENRQDAEAFLEQHPVKFPIAVDADGECPSAFGVQAMPSSYLIDRQGKIRHIQLGFHQSESADIRRKVESLLAEQ